MKLMPIVATALLIASLDVTGAQEKKLGKSQLPAAVAATVDRETKGSEIKGFTTEKEHGQRVYEAETVVAGHTRDIQVGPDGALQEVEEEVAMNTLPEGVRDGLQRKAGAGQIVKVESLTKKGTLVAYEASTLKNGKKGEVQVGPKGESLKHAE